MKKSVHNLTRFLAVFLIFYGILAVPSQVTAEPDAIIYEDSISHDEEESRLSLPSFVMVDKKMNEIYVIDGRSRIMIYTSDLFPLYTMNSESGIETPRGLALDEGGNLYVAQSSSNGNARHRISVYKPCLRKDRDIYIKDFEGAETFIPYRMAVDNKGNILVASGHYPGLIVLNNEGSLIDILSPVEQGKKVKITNVSIDEAGRIYIVSEDAGRIYIYDKNRNIIASFGEKGGSSGKLSRPRAIAIDSFNGNMFVVDYMRHTVTIFSSSGSYIHEFGGLGWDEGWFQHPNDISVDSRGRLFVADFFNHRVQIFKTR
ncbi:MAG: NHL repeat-containing protein [Nitrospiraceae bacterium]|nr:MAG: NHL repeat-containing protein [Nitrospiraceae bacterium]